jgi:hypothetical protein
MILVSPPARDRPNVNLSIGAIQVTAPDESVTPTGRPVEERLVNFDEWTQMTALVVSGAQPRRFDWNTVVSMYANTFGSHLSGTIPEVLARTSQITSHRLDLGQYLVHCAGVIAEGALNQVLADVQGAPIVQPHVSGREFNALVGLTLYDDHGRGPAFEPLVLGIHLPVGEEVDKLHFGDRYIQASYIRNAEDRVEGAVKFSKAKPGWWDLP